MSRWVPESEPNEFVREKERATNNPAREKEIATLRHLWLSGWPNSKPVYEHPALLAFCDVCKACVASESDLASYAGCKICVAKAAAMDWIKAAGGESVEVEVAKVKKPWSVAAASLSKMKEAGGYVVKTEMKDVGEGRPPVTVVTVRLPDAHIMRLMRIPSRMPLRPLSEDFFERNASLRENLRSAAASVVCSIKLHEEILSQFFIKGFAVSRGWSWTEISTCQLIQV